MPVDIRLNKELAKEMERRLKSARAGLDSGDIAMRQIATFLDQWVQRNFKTAGGKVGRWAGYTYGGRLVIKSKSNAVSMDGKRYINTRAAMLMDTGRLRNSFLPFIKKGVAGIGSDLPYSKPHNDGTNVLPQRRLLPVNAEVEPDIHSILQNFVVVQFKKAGLQ